MPRRTDIESILVIGSGPIIIGQACEFDYSGTQAVKVLRQDGFRIVLVNSNPATIMTDPELADATYIEPITPEAVELVIAAERPDALLPTLGGQTALNVTMELAARGVLDRYDVELIGAGVDAIEAAEDRGRFKQLMESIGAQSARSHYVTSLGEALAAVADIGYPAMVRPSYILGGGGTGLAHTEEELRRIVAAGIDTSPIGEVLIEESVLGWKEYELEVMCDRAGNAVVICSIENLDAMGVHTGDSITVAPAMTLSDREYQPMRDEAIACLRAVGVETGGSNVQFAVDPATGRRIVIEMNPRVSRSSALASKATGFPIAKIAAQLAVGYTLDEIANDITGATPSSFEPALDYVVVKIPRFDFAKFPSLDPVLGTSMQSVGEAMAIGRTFPEALQKGLRSLETGRLGLVADPGLDSLAATAAGTLREQLRTPTPERIFAVAEALRRGWSVAQIASLTAYDPWFVDQMRSIVELAGEIAAAPDDVDRLRRAKRLGFGDRQLAHLGGEDETAVRRRRRVAGIRRTHKTVDTCAAEFAAATPYFYGTFEDENEAPAAGERTVIVLGSGPNRIGQGIEFDYCCVHATLELAQAGYEPVMVNCNPETVSTDYDTSSRLYFEPLTPEDVLAVIDQERPVAVIVQLGGQTPLALAETLEAAGVPIAGTTPEAIALAEDRERFAALCSRLDVPQPPAGTATHPDEAERVAESLGFPLLVRPSFVLGGRGMRIVDDMAELRSYVDDLYGRCGGELDLTRSPVLIDRFLESAIEVDVDALCDGTDVYIGGIMEHVEHAGIHSGDSACVIPPPTLGPAVVKEIEDLTARLAHGLEVCGLLNIQFAVRDGEVFVIEANPRASRTVPFVSKATGVPLARLATLVMMGTSLAELRRKGRLPRTAPGLSGRVAIKEAVLPWKRFPGEDRVLGPEMRATGEVMGIAETVGAAYAKALRAAGHVVPSSGTAFISLNDADKPDGVRLAQRLCELGYRLLATHGTAGHLARNGLDVTHVDKVGEGTWDPVTLIESGEIDLVINTPTGARARSDGSRIRRAATRHEVPCVTTVRGGRLLAESLHASGGLDHVASLQSHHAAADA